MGKKVLVPLLCAVALVALTATAYADTFNGVSDFGTDEHGYYYAITGGKFPTGTIPNGDNGSGGTMRYITDSPDWPGNPALDVWHKDDWFASNAGIAVTLKNGSAIVYDNNGLEPGVSDPAVAGFYNAANYNPNDPNNPGAGAVTAYSMSNNFDWIYAGYMKLTQTTTITDLVGYFAFSGNPNDALHGNFNPSNPNLRYHMNIFSNVSGQLLPTNTGSFAGDVFTSDNTGGSFTFSDTGYDRIGSTSTQSIYRLQYSLNAPISLQAGEYWFSHDASIAPVPLPAAAWMGIALVGGVGGVRGIRYRLRRQAP
jgi:hypothetical protein